MSLSLIEEIHNKTYLGVWKIEEAVDSLFKELNLTDKETEILSAFSSLSRKQQWLSYRLLSKLILKEFEIDAHILYDKNGAPFLSNGYKISVTHTNIYSGIIVSPKNRVGIDIEKPSERIIKIRERFVSDQEMLTFDRSSIEDLTVLWVIKEAVYKLCNIKYLNFKDDILIQRTLETSLFSVKVSHKIEEAFTAYIRSFDEHLIAYIIDY